MATEARKELVNQISMLVAGSMMSDVMPALADSLARGAAFAADTPDDAEELLRELLPGMIATVRKNWAVMQEMKAAGISAPAGRA